RAPLRGALGVRAGNRRGARRRDARSPRGGAAGSARDRGSAPPSVRATYRLQLGPHLGFRAAQELVPYLRVLGVSHLYLSSCLQARAGSTHGYDVVDPRRVSEELGGEKELRALSSAGLGVILDLVPNHMAVSEENPFW